MDEAKGARAALAIGAEETRRLVAVAYGTAEPDLVLAGAEVLLPSGEVLPRDIAIRGARIAAVAEGIGGEAPRVDLRGKVVVPAYVEPHTHTLGPLSVDTYVGHGLARGIGCFVSDDSYAYTFLDRPRYERLLDYAADCPALVSWSARTDVGARTIAWSEVTAMLGREDLEQVGELATGKFLRPLDPELAELLAAAKSRGKRIEGHSPGASARTLAAAAAAGVSADHEAIRAEEVIERLRQGIFAPLRNNGLRPDVPELIPPLLESGLPLDRTAFTIDGSMPSWISRNGMIDAAIGAAIEAGLDPARAYRMASLQPATYLGLAAHVGMVAPGRLANLNVLADLRTPMPEQVFNLGQLAATFGVLERELPPVPWAEIDPPRWSPAPCGPGRDAYVGRDDDPVVHLESQAIVRTGPGPGAALTCVAIDPVGDTFSRARFHGFPAGLRAVATTLTPECLLVAIGSDPDDLRRCVDAIYAAGGGLAYVAGEELRVLPLPIGGAITAAPFEEVARFWTGFEDHMAALGHELPAPTMTLMFIPTDALPGTRFLRIGLVETRSEEVLSPARPIAR
jgi:adenine deaminase